MDDANRSESQPTATSGRNARLHVLLVCLGLSLLNWLVFGQTVGHQFVNYDDYAYVVDNPAVSKGLTWAGIKWAFTHSHSYNWHPLTSISHMVDCHLYGLRAGGHHATNVILHTLSAVLLFLVMRTLTGVFWQSAYIAALFSVHPLHVESVAWVAERKDVLSGLFFMLTLAAYARYVGKPSLPHLLLVCFAFTLGLLTKPMLVTVPFVLLLLDYWPLGRFSTSKSVGKFKVAGLFRNFNVPYRLIAEKLPLLFLSGVSAVITIVAQGSSVSSMRSLPLWVRVYQACISIVTYIYQMLWPAKLAAFYPYPRGALPVLPLVFGGAVLLVTTLGTIKLRHRYPYSLTGWLWYLIMLVPVLGIVQVGIQSRADRYTYLPHIGLYLIVTWGIVDLAKRWPRRREILVIGAVSSIAVLACLTWKQTGFWKDSESLWRHALAVTQSNAVAHNDLGKALDRKGRFGEASAHFQKAVELWPEYADGNYHLGGAMFRKGRIDEAIAYWKKTIALRPSDADAHYGLGQALLLKKDPRQAVAHFERSLQIKPASSGVLNDLAWTLATCSDDEIRDGSRALSLARQADRLGGGEDARCARTLAAAFAENQLFKEAIETARRALTLAEKTNDRTLASQIRMDIDLYSVNLPRR